MPTDNFDKPLHPVSEETLSINNPEAAERIYSDRLEIEEEGEDEWTDEELIATMELDLIVKELRRRNCPMIFANDLGMMGRVVFIPAALEVQRAQQEKTIWREEIRRRNAKKPPTGTGRMGVPPERQVQHGMDAKGDDTGVVRLTSRLDIPGPHHIYPDRNQGSTWPEFGVRPATRPSTTGTTGI